jgi:hypothetical protein
MPWSSPFCIYYTTLLVLSNEIKIVPIVAQQIKTKTTKAVSKAPQKYQRNNN